jgi:uncharacterized protein YgiM (DUF1202 family)
MSTRSFGWCRRHWSRFVLLVLALLYSCATASAQSPREQVRVPKRHANVQAGPSSGSIVLVLVPQGTVLPVLERRGPWVVVELSPKLREVGTPMRWYRGEQRGYMHESTVEFIKAKK